MTSFNLHGLRMNAVETAENGVVNADTLFDFTQEGEIVTASYKGGGITLGHLIGLLRGAKLEFRYAQLQADGVLDGGVSQCDVERTDDGRVRLVEHFSWESRDGGGTNVIQELSADASAGGRSSG